MEENNNMNLNVKEKSNKNIVLIVIIIILSLLLLGLTYYTFFVRDNNKINDNKPSESENGDNSKIVDELKNFPYNEMIENFKGNGNSISDKLMIYITYIMMDHSRTSDGLDINVTSKEEINENKIDIKAISNNRETIEGLNSGAIPLMYDGLIFKNKVIELFGTDNNIFEKSFYFDDITESTICGGYTTLYDNKADKIIFHSRGGCVAGGEASSEKNYLYNKVKTVFNVTDNANEYIIDVMNIKIHYNTEYTSFDLYDFYDDSLIASNLKCSKDTYEGDANKALNQYKDKLGGYKFTFKKVDGHYQFENIVKNENQNSDEQDESYKIDTSGLVVNYKTIEDINKSIEELPYTSIINYNKSYGEIYSEYVMLNSYLKLDKKYITDFNFTSEFGKIQDVNKKKLWEHINGGATEFALIDLSNMKERIKELYNVNIDLFKKSFVIGINSYDYPISIAQILYDNDSKKLIWHDGGGGIGSIYTKKLILDHKIEDNKYIVDLIESTFEAKDSSIVLKAKNDNEIILAQSDYEKLKSEHGINNSNLELMDKILKDNQDKLQHYELTFRLVDDAYQFDSIVKK